MNSLRCVFRTTTAETVTMRLQILRLVPFNFFLVFLSLFSSLPCAVAVSEPLEEVLSEMQCASVVRTFSMPPAECCSIEIIDDRVAQRMSHHQLHYGGSLYRRSSSKPMLLHQRRCRSGRCCTLQHHPMHELVTTSPKSTWLAHSVQVIPASHTSRHTMPERR